ncbi:MAG: flavin reductase family protein [Candidatus Omnitrophota bacterium]|jgi:flavin reductase (DIM6/NTAB) family NADH-FMN oxidoreductase RutF
MKKSIGAITIVFPTPVFVIGTYGKEDQPNAMVAAWGGICCSDPACVNVSLREATHTYDNILENKAFTVNIPSEACIKEVDYFGIVSGKTENKFTSTGLTPVKSELVNAPYIKEFPLVLECYMLHAVKVGLHTVFIGQIKDVKVEEEGLTKEGFPDIEKIKPMIFNPASRTYYGVGKYLGDAFSIGKKNK